jgi:hypothetical protein
MINATGTLSAFRPGNGVADPQLDLAEHDQARGHEAVDGDGIEAAAHMKEPSRPSRPFHLPYGGYPTGKIGRAAEPEIRRFPDETSLGRSYGPRRQRPPGGPA